MSEYEDPRHLEEYDQAVQRELDQREWESDDTRILPKPRKRYRATKKAWEELRSHFSGLPCWVCGGAWEDLHHIVPRSKSGDDVYANLAPLCRECHGRVEARDAGARSAIREHLNSRHYSYLRHRLGETWEGWLDRHYPALVKEAA